MRYGRPPRGHVMRAQAGFGLYWERDVSERNRVRVSRFETCEGGHDEVWEASSRLDVELLASKNGAAPTTTLDTGDYVRPNIPASFNHSASRHIAEHRSKMTILDTARISRTWRLKPRKTSEKYGRLIQRFERLIITRAHGLENTRSLSKVFILQLRSCRSPCCCAIHPLPFVVLLVNLQRRELFWHNSPWR